MIHDTPVYAGVNRLLSATLKKTILVHTDWFSAYGCGTTLCLKTSPTFSIITWTKIMDLKHFWC